MENRAVNSAAQTGCADTPVEDHVSYFWRLLKTEHVRVQLNLRRIIGTDAPEGPIEYWDSSNFGDEVARAIFAERLELLAALKALVDEAINPTGSQVVEAAISTAEAALAKAESNQ